MNSSSNLVSPDKSMSLPKTTWSTVDCVMGMLSNVRTLEGRALGGSPAVIDMDVGSTPNLSVHCPNPSVRDMKPLLVLLGEATVAGLLGSIISGRGTYKAPPIIFAPDNASCWLPGLLLPPDAK